MNVLTVAATLVRLQMLRKWRAITTLLVLALPLLQPILAWIFEPNATEAASATYADLVVASYFTVLMPLLVTFWGSSAISDEIEGRTIVYLWTRPTGRWRVLVAKLFWLMLFAGASFGLALLAAYTLVFARVSFEGYRNTLMFVAWDTLAITAGSLAYLGLGYLLAASFRKPFAWAIGFLITWDSASMFLPGYLGSFTIRYHVFVLSSSLDVNRTQSNSLLSFLQSADTTAAPSTTTSLLVLVGTFLAFVIGGSLLLKYKEYIGDEAARTQ